MKQQIINDIISRLTSLGVKTDMPSDCDISINSELLEASFSTGKKKISYEASIFLDDHEKIAYMYEKTTEAGQGFSFGSTSSSSFQSGQTLFRKVKSIQYGVDGKAYEYSFDLGAIPKAVKESAKNGGYQFKTVLKKSKAMYPTGYQSPKRIEKEKPVEKAPDIVKHTSDKVKNKSLATLSFLSLAFISVIFFLMFQTSITGWVVTGVVLLIYFLVKKGLSKKGCLLLLLMWVLSLGIIFIIFLFTTDFDSAVSVLHRIAC